MIKVSKKAHELIIHHSFEECGFLYGFKKFEKVHPIKNVAKKEYEFKMKKISALKFLIWNMFMQLDFCIYHVHKDYGYPSISDARHWVPGILYLIVYNGELYFYKKENNRIIKLEHEII